MDVLLPRSYTRFLCSPINWNLQQAKKKNHLFHLPVPLPLPSYATNKIDQKMSSMLASQIDANFTPGSKGGENGQLIQF